MSIDLKVEADLTESANNLLSEPAKSSGLAIATVINFIHNTVLLPMQKYNIKAPIKLVEYEKKLKEKIGKIPEEKQVDPSMNIWGQTMDSLKWNLGDEQEHIREMFTKILTADVNKDTKNLVQPAFIDIVRQLSYADAKFLTDWLVDNHPINIYEDRIYTRPIGNSNEPREYIVLCRRLISIKTGQMFKGNCEKTLDNLKRLGVMIEHANQHWGTDEQIAQHMKRGVWRSEQKVSPMETRQDTIQSGMLDITDFGRDFIKICLGEFSLAK